MSTPRLELAGVKKRFGTRQVLDGVDIAVMPGESLVIIGGSGTGKSVTLKCVLGLIPIDAGSIRVDGAEVAGLTGRALEAHRARFGMLFQGGALFDSLPVWRNVAFALPGSAADRKAAAIDNLARVGLGPEVADLKPSELSGGMQKRVAFARALAANPEIVVLDDPTAGLDPIVTAAISKLIDRIIRDSHATALIITQDLTVITHIAKRVAMLHDGRIIWTGPAETVTRSGNPYVDQFIHGRRKGPITVDVVAA